MKPWIATTIGEQLVLQRGIDITREQQRPGSVPVVSSGGTSSYHDTAAVKGPGVVLGRKGVVGSVYYVPQDYWPHDTTLYVKDFRGNEPRFGYYFFKRRARELASLDVGSANPTLNRNHVHPTPVQWPPLPEQRAIARILGALDDKIELNRRTNETLEAMARAIFQSWFVDFDPVRAKMEGRQPEGMDAETARLFPSALQASPLGLLPAGWIAAQLRSRTSTLQYGLTASASLTQSGPKFLRITDIQGGRIDWSKVPWCARDASDLDRYALRDGDILVARTGASTGENVMVVEPPTAVFASYLVRLQFLHPGTSRVVAEFLRTEAYQAYIAAAMGGSAQPNASAQTLAAASMCFPTNAIADAFYDRLRPSDLARVQQAKESVELSTLRDTLLPKLLSGELRVPEAERAVSAAL